MVITIIMAILSHFNIVAFNWYVTLVEGIVFMLIGIGAAVSESDSDISPNMGNAAYGLGWGTFAAYKIWFSLSLNSWWILLSGLVVPIAVFLPGGISLMNWLLSHFELAVISPAAWTIGYVLDGIMLLIEIIFLIIAIKD